MIREREGMRVGRDQEQARVAAVEKARRWTLSQSARLELMPKEILAAVRGGWLPEDIEGVDSKYRLEDGPLMPGCVRFKIISEGRVQRKLPSHGFPITRGSKKNTARHRKHLRSEKLWADKTAEGASMMAVAFMKAQDRGA